jgi:hypothetical protein
MHRRFLVVLAALVLVGGACGGSKHDSVKTANAKRTTTTASASDTTLGGTDVSASATTAKGAATTVKAGTTATAAKSAAAGAPPATADPNAVPGPAATGTYDYAQSGTTSDGNPPSRGTLAVLGGGPSQVFRRSIDSNSSSDITFNFTNSGPFITKVVVNEAPLQPITCTFGSPVPVPPWPPTTGRSFSGHATCDGGYSADFNGSITGRTTDHVAGTVVDTIVINSTLHITGNGIDATVKDTEHWAPSLRVPTYSHEVINGTGPFGATITGDVTSVLQSTTPH